MAELDVRDAWKVLRQLIKKSASVEVAMTELISYCDKRAPAHVWKQVGELDFRSDYQRLSKWLTSILSGEPPPTSIKALWLGLYLPLDFGGNISLGLYVCGSKTFDQKDETFDWASSPTYCPEGRYAQSAVLKEIYDLSQNEPSLSTTLQEIVGVGFVAISMAQICREQPRTILHSAKKRHVAAGFDAGDGFLIGTVTPDGFQPAVHREVDHLKPLKPTRSKAEFYVFKLPSPWQWAVKDIENKTKGGYTYFAGHDYEPVVDGWETEPLPRERRPPVDVLYPVIGPPIIHERIAKRIGELAGDAVQLIPVTVRKVSSDTSKYMIFHVLKQIDCIDLEASRVFRTGTGPPRVLQPVLRRSLASGNHVFRIDGPPEEIVISREVKEIMEGERVSGIKLVPLDTTN